MGKKPTTAAYVLGVGMTKFVKPRNKIDYTELGYEAGVKALLDAQINYDDVDQGIACYCFGDSTCGQRVFYQFGMTQIPIVNVNNNCATGSTGLHLGRNLVSHGAADCVLVVGFEKMFPGSIQAFFQDRENPTGTTVDMMKATRGITNAPGAAQMFGNAGREYMEKYGATKEDFAEIARINHEHSQRNPYSQFRDEYTLQQILDSPVVHSPLTKLQCCPTSDGGAAAVIVSQSFLDSRPHLLSQAIQIAGQCLATDGPSLFDRSSINLMGFEMTAFAAKTALAEANVDARDIKLCELHDCFSANELITIDALGLSPRGKAHEMVRAGDITYGGRCVINPSGGLISKGHPLGATGLAQCAEMVWQLRGWANNRLVEGAAAALQHNLGLGGAVVCTVYKRADGRKNELVSSEDVARLGAVGYNPAVEARGFTREMAGRVRSRTRRSEWALGQTERKVEARF
ncbi:MAG: non-specific lipid-transfer [Lasallia pustulata]|uniref:propanoyl-CoA C-acyltransferase n=1 Tax=Lasallia pustulata TaxID=136370 RepID=A0A5M8PM13_9LECA|nr:MAG: non-specific lipid-transfer [Lasallia pustulata]